jgi:hypothetical protein
MDRGIKSISKRVSVSEHSDKTTIVITPDYDSQKQMILSIWIVLWTIGGLIVVSQLFKDYSREEKLFLGVWVCFWIYFEHLTVHAWLWKKFGIEKIVINKENMSYSRKIKSYGKVQTFNKASIIDLRPAQESDKSIITSLNNSYWNIGGEKIAFNYNSKEIRIGLKLDKKETPEILKIIGRNIK